MIQAGKLISVEVAPIQQQWAAKSRRFKIQQAADPYPAKPDPLFARRPFPRDQQVPEHRRAYRSLFPPTVHLCVIERPLAAINQLPGSGSGEHLLLEPRQILAGTPARLCWPIPCGGLGTQSSAAVQAALPTMRSGRNRTLRSVARSCK